MIALVALPESVPPGLEAIRACLSHHFDDSVVVTDDENGTGVRVAVGTLRARVAPVDEPMPRELLEGPCATAWYWPDAAAVLDKHRSQLAIVVEGEGSEIHRSLLLTRLTAVLGESFAYLGVYWDNATMVHSATAFTETAREMTPTEFPLKLWVALRFVPHAEPGVTSVATVGLEALGRMEIEIQASRRPPEELLRWAFNTAYYMLQGKPIEDDQTVGWEEERVLIKHQDSMLVPGRQVLSLKL